MTMAAMGLAAVMVVNSGDAVQQSPRRDPVVNEISGFSIVLVLGETQPGSAGSTQELPKGAARAINDMREFLPYKHFRVLDVQWISCCGSRSGTTVSGRLQGVVSVAGPGADSTALSPRAHSFSLTATASAINIPVRFVLTQDEAAGRRPGQYVDDAQIERRRRDLQAEIETLKLQIEQKRRQVEVGLAAALDVRQLEDRHASLVRELEALTTIVQGGTGSGRPIVDSSFTMDAGETVVVGTSKLGGDTALIALVTAVRKNMAAREP